MNRDAKGPEPQGGFRWSQSKRRILLVDDNCAIRDAVTGHLKEQLPYIAVSFAGSGLEALDVVSNKRVDMLITEVDLPGMNGYDLIEKVRMTRPEMPIMVTTDDCSIKVLELLTSLKVNKWLEKPFTAKAIVAAVRTELDRLAV